MSKKFLISKSLYESLLKNPLFAETIEKARKGETKPHKYIFRKQVKDGWIYFYLEDLIKNPIKKIEEFFGITEKQIDEKYKAGHIKEEFGADKKTFAQHIAEYFSHRSIWDKRFADKATRDRNKKPIPMKQQEKIPEQKGMETPDAQDDQLSLFSESEMKQEKEWKANPSLMRKIWGMYTGKAIEQQEKQQELAQKKLDKTNLSKIKKPAAKVETLPSSLKPGDTVKFGDIYYKYVGLDEEGKPQIAADVHDTKGNVIDTTGIVFDDVAEFNRELKSGRLSINPDEPKKEEKFSQAKADEIFNAAKVVEDTTQSKPTAIKYGITDHQLDKMQNLIFNIADENDLLPLRKDGNIDKLFGILQNSNKPYIQKLHADLSKIYQSYDKENLSYTEFFKDFSGPTVMGSSEENVEPEENNFSDNEKWQIRFLLKEEMDFDPTLSAFAYYEKIRDSHPELNKPGLLSYIDNEMKNPTVEPEENQIVQIENAVEEHKNRSEAMLGNQNAYKGGPKEVDWYQAFAGSWNKFYPSGTGLKPYITTNFKNEKGQLLSLSKRGKSKTDLSGLFDGVNDFVFDSEHITERQTNAMLERLAELGFHAQKKYTENGNTKYLLMIRDGSKSGNVEMIPGKSYMDHIYTIVTHDDEGNEIESKVFDNIDAAQEYMDDKRKELNSNPAETSAAAENDIENRINTYRDDEYRITKEMYKDDTRSDILTAIRDAEQEIPLYERDIAKYDAEIENPSDPGMFATPETIAENDRAMRYNRDNLKLEVAKLEGKIKALKEMNETLFAEEENNAPAAKTLPRYPELNKNIENYTGLKGRDLSDFRDNILSYSQGYVERENDKEDFASAVENAIETKNSHVFTFKDDEWKELVKNSAINVKNYARYLRTLDKDGWDKLGIRARDLESLFGVLNETSNYDEFVNRLKQIDQNYSEETGIADLTVYQDYFNSMQDKYKDKELLYNDLRLFKENLDKEFTFLKPSEETEQEKHDNRSAAMMGNQNARKYGLSDSEFDKLMKEFKNTFSDWNVENGVLKLNKDYTTAYGTTPEGTVLDPENVAGAIVSRIIENGKKLKQTDRVYLKDIAEKAGYKSVNEFMKNFLNDFIADNPNYQNNAIISGVGGNANDNNIEQAGISESNSDIRPEGSGNRSNDVPGTEGRADSGNDLLDVGNSGRGPANADNSAGTTGSIDNGSGKLTAKQARQIREACKKLLAEKSDSEMTAEDKALLAQYVGAGGIKEENASNSGVLYEFYTPRNVINKVWQLVDKYLPDQNKKVIEPSSGIGRFAEGRPEKFTMFEFEEDSARIAKILHPDAEVVQGAFEKNFMEKYKGRYSKGIKEEQKFDVAIGNPPYGKFTGKFKGEGEGKGHTSYVEYFIDRSLDTLKDNGILAFVVPQGFLNGANSKIKEKLAGKAKLLEAWRLPSGTFDSTAVGTDIIVLRKEPGNTEDFTSGKYFENNPSHIMGKIVKDWRGNDQVVPMDGKTADEEIDSINVEDVQAIIKKLPQVEVKVEEKAEIKPVTADHKFGEELETPNGKGKITGFVKNGNNIIGYKVRVPGKDVSDTVYVTDAEKHEHRSDAMKGNKNAEGKRGGAGSSQKREFVPSTGKNMTVEEFNSKYGKNFDTKDLPIWQMTDSNGNIDMTKLTPEQRKYVQSSDHYVNDNGVYTNVVNYASGNIREKLQQLEYAHEHKSINDEEYEFRKSLLEQAKPVDKELPTYKTIEIQNADGTVSKREIVEGFTLSPIADWTKKYRTKDGKDLITSFFEWAYNGNDWFNSSDSPITPEEIPPEISFTDIKDYIRAIPCVKERSETPRMKYRRQEKRREAAEKLFNRFLREGLTLEEQEDLKKRWNENFNTYANPDYTKIPVFIDGMNENKGTRPFTLTKQQLKGIAQLTNKGSGLLAYDVGVGKTVTGICATVAQIQSGRSKRPLICVPKSVYKNWIESIHQHFPNIKVNELGNLGKQYVDPNFVPEDGSISVCTYQALEHFNFNEKEEEELKNDLEFGAFMETHDKPLTDRQAASQSEKIDEALGGLTKTKGDTVDWSAMGFDHITVDEVHNMRNLFTVVKKIQLDANPDDGEIDNDSKSESNEFKGVGGGKPSNQAKKLFAITQLIQRHNDNRNVFLLSATPFQNSPIEIYSILSYMARDRLKQLGINSLEQFVKQFAQMKSEYVIKANKIEEKQIMKNFNNLNALQNLITEYIDKVDGEEAGVPRPYKVTHTPELEMTDEQREIMDACNNYIEEQEKLAKDDRDPGYMFRAMNAMRMCTLSPALVDRNFFGPLGLSMNADKIVKQNVVECSPKLKFVCDSIIAQYKKAETNGQVMYMPSGVDRFDEVKAYLVKKGIPADAIGLMQGSASTDKELDRRQELMDNFNDVNGKCKILIGSGTIKEGVSLNGNSTVLYNCQLGWNPSEDVQVEGRIWRQGNKQGKTHIVYPLMHDTIDSMLYQKHYEKQSRLDALYSYKGDSLNVEDINPDELRWGLIKDPDKRADLQVKQYKEENENNQKLYAQLIDVLHTHERIAFIDDPVKTVQEKYTTNFVEKQQQEIDSYNETAKEAMEIVKRLKKDWKGKEDQYYGGFYRNLDDAKYKHYTIQWAGGTGKGGLQAEIEDFENKAKTMKDYAASSQRMLTKYNQEIKKAQDRQKATIAYLKSKGINNLEDAKKKNDEYVKLMDEARDNVQTAEVMREEFYQKAVEDNKKNDVKLLSLDEMVKQNVEDIMDNLVPFADVKEQIMEDLKKKYPYLNKSIMCVRNGRILIIR